RGRVSPAGSLGRFHHLGEPPALRARERPRLDDPDDVADVRLVALVVRVELPRAPDDLLVARVHLQGLDAHDDRLVHRARDDDAAALLAAAALGLGLRLANEQLALARLLPHPDRLRPLGAQRPWEALLLRLLRL